MNVLATLLRRLLIRRWRLLLLICPMMVLNGPVTLTRHRPPRNQLFRVMKM